MSTFRAVLVSAVLLFCPACSNKNGDADLPGRPAPDSRAQLLADRTAADLSPAPGGLPFQEFYDELQANVLLLAFENGDWLDDFGDAAYYGPAFFVAAGIKYDRPDYVDIGIEAFERNFEVILMAQEDLGYFLGQLEEILMAALGIIEVISHTGAADGLADLDLLVDLVNDTADGFGTYLNIEMESYALETYGPTTITAVVALLNLRYAELLDTPRRNERLQHGLKVLGVIDGVAWSGEAYRFRPEEDKLFLYPNVVMTIANATAFKLTGDAAYLQRCLDTYAGIQPLKDTQKLCYRSPYSAEYMGAQTEDYSTLSSQNFTMMALALLFEVTADTAFRDELADIARFIHDYLYVDGRILHHWMDGAVAVPADPEYYYSDYNLQFLYINFYYEEYVYDD